MISAPDRQHAVALIAEACRAGARLRPACAPLGLSVRNRPAPDPGRCCGLKVDGRPEAVRPEPANRLSAEEREQVLAVCHEPAYVSLPPSENRAAARRSGHLYRLGVELLSYPPGSR